MIPSNFKEFTIKQGVQKESKGKSYFRTDKGSAWFVREALHWDIGVGDMRGLLPSSSRRLGKKNLKISKARYVNLLLIIKHLS